MLLDETFRVQTTAPRHWKWQAAILLAVSGTVFPCLLFQSRGLACPGLRRRKMLTRSDAVQTYHAKFAVSRGTGEMWVQLKPDGTPLRGRVDTSRRKTATSWSSSRRGKRRCGSGRRTGTTSSLKGLPGPYPLDAGRLRSGRGAEAS